MIARHARADGTARRVFRILRNGDDIGTHTLDARLIDGAFEIDILIDIKVRVLGFTAYRYELQNREVWRGGELQSLDSTTNDDGSEDRARIRREDGGLVISGSGFDGRLDGSVATTSYYTTAFHDRRPWVSSQSGKPLDVTVSRVAQSPLKVDVSGELETHLIYDERGEWIGCEFDAGGEPGSYEVVENVGGIAALWAEV